MGRIRRDPDSHRMTEPRMRRSAWRARHLVNDHVRRHPCQVCGCSDIMLLDFDHRERSDKCAAISDLVASGASLVRLQQEMAKCDILCVACHRAKTIRERAEDAVQIAELDAIAIDMAADGKG